jgi:hypothetical protein
VLSGVGEGANAWQLYADPRLCQGFCLQVKCNCCKGFCLQVKPFFSYRRFTHLLTWCQIWNKWCWPPMYP